MLNHTLGTIEIPEDVWWSDEFAWSEIDQATEYSVTGSLIIDIGTKLAGRQITLQSNSRGGWVPRSTVLALQAQRGNPGATYTLRLADGREYTVAHDHSRNLEAEPIRPAAGMTGITPYRITIPLIEV